jgi:hypothetical protein
LLLATRLDSGCREGIKIEMKKYLLASACLVMVGAMSSPSFADGVAFTADGNFGNVAGTPTWNAGAGIDIPLNFGWNGLSIDGGIDDAGFGPVHVFDGGGSLVWRGGDWLLAGTVYYNQLTEFGSFNATSYGGGGEWYATPWLTAAVDGGGISGSGSSGGYVGGGLKGYICPDAALDGRIDYLSISSEHVTNYGLHAEWLPMESLPVSLNATYGHISTSFGDTDMWMVGLKLYLNDSPATSLEDRQRTGRPDMVGGPASGLAFVF